MYNLDTKITRTYYLPIFLWIIGSAFGMIMPDLCRAEEARLYTAQGKRDPFVQLVGIDAKQTLGQLIGVESIEEVMIEGIVLDANPKASIVVVTGTVMKEGDEVVSAKVIKIKSNGVMFAVNGIESMKPLYQEDK